MELILQIFKKQGNKNVYLNLNNLKLKEEKNKSIKEETIKKIDYVIKIALLGDISSVNSEIINQFYQFKERIFF